jgi:hypothetical protein
MGAEIFFFLVWVGCLTLNVGRGQEGGRGQASSQVGRETIKATRPTSIATIVYRLLFPFVCLVSVYSGGLSWPPFSWGRCNINTVCGL